MTLNLQCILIGLLTMIFWLIVLIVVSNKNIDGFKMQELINNRGKYPNIKINLLISFLLGYILHYFVVHFNLAGLYCEKKCYDDKCFDICIKNN